MKNILAILVSALCIVAFSISGNAEQPSKSGESDSQVESSGSGDSPFAAVLSMSPDGSLEAFSGKGMAPFVPIQLDQFVISLLDTTNDDTFDEGSLPHQPSLELNAGIKTESYLTEPRSFLKDELFGGDPDSLKVNSSVLFVGLGLDFNAIHLEGNAYVGRPLALFPDKLSTPLGSEHAKGNEVDTNVYGFEASAGYQLNNKIALGASFGKMTDKNQETDETEEIYAVYAQAILAVAPGIHVKPEVGKMDRVKEETEEIDESFYAGTIWEINF